MITRLEAIMQPARWFSTIVLSLTLAASAAAQSQITTGVIDGIVLDASGGVLPGVDVEIRNVDTNLVRSLTTDRNGRFVALQLPPGRYSVSLALSGFATLRQENVVDPVLQVRVFATDVKLTE